MLGSPARWILHAKRSEISKLESPGNTHKRVEVIRRVCQTDIDPGIELQVAGDFVSHAEVGRSNPASVALRADFAVEFSIAFQFSIKAVLKRYRMDEGRMMAPARL